jgi:hypothetical protein
MVLTRLADTPQFTDIHFAPTPHLMALLRRDTAMRGMFEEHYRGHRIIASETEAGIWQARIEGIGALSEHRSNPRDAIGETKRYLDDQTEHD